MRVAPVYSRRTKSSRNNRGLLKRVLGKGKNLVHLFPANSGEPLDELVYGRPLIKVFEQGGNRKARALETPAAPKLPWVPIDRAAKAPVHTDILNK